MGWGAVIPIAASVIGNVVGGKSGGGSKTVPVNEPWNGQQPYLLSGYQQAQDWYNNQMAQNLPWNAPFLTTPQRNAYQQTAMDMTVNSIPALQNFLADAYGVYANNMMGGVSAPYGGMIGPLLSSLANRGGGMPATAGGFMPSMNGAGAGMQPRYTLGSARPAPFQLSQPDQSLPNLIFPFGANPQGSLGSALMKYPATVQSSAMGNVGSLAPDINWNASPITSSKPAEETDKEKQARWAQGDVKPAERAEYSQWYAKTYGNYEP